MGTAAGRGPPLPPPSGGPPSGMRRAATTTGCRDAAPHPPGAFLTAPLRRPRARSGAGPCIDTHVSQEERDAAHDRDRAPAPRRGALVSANDAREAAIRAADWEGPPRHWDGRLFCGHGAMVPFTSTCAACFPWHGFRNTGLPCGHQPSDPYPTGCDVCRFYFEDLDACNGRPRRLACGQTAACPIMWGSCSHCLCAGHTHGTYDFLFCGRTLDRPGRNCPSCTARRDMHVAEGGMHVISSRHFHRGAGAANRSWSPPNRHDVMTGQFGRRDGALEAGQRLNWLEAVRRVTGVDPRELRPHSCDRFRRSSRTVEQAGRRGAPEGDAGRVQAHRYRRAEEQDGRWVRDTHPRFEERDGRLGGTASRLELVPGGDGPAAGSHDRGLDRVSVASSRHSVGARGKNVNRGIVELWFNFFT